MPLATVLIPTHDHADTVERAIHSVRQQSVQDFELLVVGDGAPERTRAIMARLCAQDGRIRWFDRGKGEGHGEAHRHAALQEARGAVVCYLSDDDLWLPGHLAGMIEGLAAADAAVAIKVGIHPDGAVRARSADLAARAIRQRMLTERWNFFGLSCFGHRLDAYRRLPHGWRPKPSDMPSDLYMWRQWLAQPWCRFASLPQPTVLHFAASRRLGWSAGQRAAELDAWLARMAEAGFAAWLATRVLADWQPRMEIWRWEVRRRPGLWFSRQLAASGDIAAALRAVREAIALEPNDGELHLQLGTLLENSGEVSAAAAAYRRAAELDLFGDVARRRLRRLARHTTAGG